jgi:DtxR family Mn-dependent transcriptional regulator
MERQEIDEHLETVWHLLENKESDIHNFKRHTKGTFDEAILTTLQEEGYITLKGDAIVFTDRGFAQAEQIMRRHRLAERLLTDVLGMNLGDIEVAACEFEHVLASELVESICTLLGHPRECPHGGRIPEGECCKQVRTTLSSAVIPLTEVDIGEEVKVAYINTRSNSRMHKLSHFGVLPGSSVSVHQRYPSFVITCGDHQIAIEEDIAREVYVWQKEKPAVTTSTPTQERKRWRFGKGS